MSVEAISWAFQQPVPHSSAKFVLVAMANHADQDMRCWPSTAHLASQTSQDRKTVIANIARLRELGYLEDTGERRGHTKSVVVFRLCTPKNGTASERQNNAESAASDTENGTAKHDQNRDSLAGEAVPFFPTSSTVFPHKLSQISPQAVPKTGHGTIKNHQEPSRNHKTYARELPDWLPLEAWTGYLEMRKAKKKPPTDRALDLLLVDLGKFRAEGHDVGAILDASTVNGWTGVYAPKPQSQQAKPGYLSQNDKARAWADSLTGRNRNDAHDEPEFIDINPAPDLVG